MLHEGQGSMRAQVTGKPGGMSPLQVHGADSVGHKHGLSGPLPGFGWDRCFSQTCFPIPQLSAIARHGVGMMVLGFGVIKVGLQWQERAFGLTFLDPGR
jgi:hypothetical protein